jgi:hypothetical protein
MLGSLPCEEHLSRSGESPLAMTLRDGRDQIGLDGEGRGDKQLQSEGVRDRRALR